MDTERVIQDTLVKHDLGWVIVVRELSERVTALEKRLEAKEEESRRPIPVETAEAEPPKVEKILLPQGANGRFCIAPLLDSEGGGQCGQALKGEQQFFCSTAHAQRWRKRNRKIKPTSMFHLPPRTFVAGVGERK